MSHANCWDCGAIISCGYGSCSDCKGKIVKSDEANKHGHWGRCDECFAKLPEGTKSEYIISFEEDLSKVESDLDWIIVQIRDLEKKRDYLESRKAILQKELDKYKGFYNQEEDK